MAGTEVTPQKFECFVTEFCWIHQLLLQTMSNKLIETTAKHCRHCLQIWHHSVKKNSNFYGVTAIRAIWCRVLNDVITASV